MPKINYYKAYVPSDKGKNPPEIKDNQTQPYPEEGTTYGAYSKSKIKPKELNYQAPVNFVLVRPSFSGIEIHSFNEFPPDGKKLYIRSMQINTSISAVDVNSYIKFYSSPSGKIVFETALLRSETTNLFFDVPLIFEESAKAGVSPSGFTVKISSGAATLNVTSINMQGWTE